VQCQYFAGSVDPAHEQYCLSLEKKENKGGTFY